MISNLFLEIENRRLNNEYHKLIRRIFLSKILYSVPCPHFCTFRWSSAF